MDTLPTLPSLSSRLTSSSRQPPNSAIRQAEAKCSRGICRIPACPAWGKDTARKPRACIPRSRLLASTCSRVRRRPPSPRRGRNNKLRRNGGPTSRSKMRRWPSSVHSLARFGRKLIGVAFPNDARQANARIAFETRNVILSTLAFL